MHDKKNKRTRDILNNGYEKQLSASSRLRSGQSQKLSSGSGSSGKYRGKKKIKPMSPGGANLSSSSSKTDKEESSSKVPQHD